MTARLRVLACAAVAALVVASCGGDAAGEESAVPDGYQLVEHPDAVVAVPEGWEAADEPIGRDDDPDALQYDSPESPALSMLLWRLDQPAYEGTTVVAAAGVVVARRELNPGFEYLANEPVDLAGADDAHLVQVEWDGGSGTVHQTVVAARSGETAVVVTFAGTDEHRPDEAVEVALDTLRMT